MTTTELDPQASAEDSDGTGLETRPLVGELRRIRSLLASFRDGTQALPMEWIEPSPGGVLAALFDLSPFERDVVLLAAAVELDAEIGRLVAGLQGGQEPRPTFGLALAVLPAAHWDALASTGPLRRWGLLELEPGRLLAERPLMIDEAALAFLTGTEPHTAQLDGIVRSTRNIEPVSPGQAQAALAAAQVLINASDRTLLMLDGDDVEARLGVARIVAATLDRSPLWVDAVALPAPGPDLARVALLVDRQVRLSNGLPLIETNSAGAELVGAFVDQLESPIVVTIGPAPAATGGRVPLRGSVPLPEPREARQLWSTCLGVETTERLHPVIEEAAQQFRLSAGSIRAISTELLATTIDEDDLSMSLRRLCRERARVPLDNLAVRVDSVAGWDDLVLPPGHMEIMRDIVAHVRHRTQVHERWGFGARTTRGLGITALFTGESGTGKTLAAEVLARELGLDLYRIDLATTVNKYIGETEKNLRRIFEAAEASGAVLLFDESDALFGKRGEVRDAHDRYANLEVAYLLQRMETYRGLAILTTNLRSNIDRAFLRRLRFVVQFPFPDIDQRAEIWRRSFPDQADTQHLAPENLARLNVPGGSINSIALGAAFLAAAEGASIASVHVLRAARLEYAKAERSLTDSELEALR